MRFEAVIYDDRDKASKDVSSTLGMYDSVLDATEAIATYLVHRGDDVSHIYKVEVVVADGWAGPAPR